MKKIFLFSVIVSCFCIVSGAFAAGDTCFEIKPGGGVELENCFDDNIPENWTFVDDEDHHVVCYPNGAKVWKEKGSPCNPANAPEGAGICIDSRKSAEARLYWIMSEEALIDPDALSSTHLSLCNDLIGAVKENNKLLCEVETKKYDYWTICKELKLGGEVVAEFPKTSCAAKECNPGWLLYTVTKRQEIPVVGEDRKVGSQGICYKRSSLEQKCKENCAQCPGNDPNKECRLKEVKVLNYGKEVDAFIGEEACVCVDKNNGGNENTPVVVPGDSCVYHFDGNVICLDGHVVKYDGYEMTLTSEQMGSFTCDEFNKQFKNDMKKLLELAPELCEQGQGGSSQGSSQGGGNGGGSANVSLENAKTTISKFFADAKSDRSVWKTAEGKFNTARLASDLTAGVVLGTVGGVVSGVVIKKKQVEKGFEALHCAVGGQTIADWGDTFTVGLK